MRVQLWDKGQGCTMRKNCTSNSSLGFCSVIDTGYKSGEEECKNLQVSLWQYIRLASIWLCVYVRGERTISKSEEVYHETGSRMRYTMEQRMWKCTWDRHKVTLWNRKMRVQYETERNCTFNSSLALVLWYRLVRKVEDTLSDRKIEGVFMYVCMCVCVKVYCTCFALVLWCTVWV